MSNDVQCVLHSNNEMKQRQAMLAAGLLTMVFCFGHYFGKPACWLIILVVSRDIMIVSGFMLSWLIGKPMPVKPLPVSKLNTVAQIVLATLALAEQAFGFTAGPVEMAFMALVSLTTLLSIAFYLATWIRHMNSYAAGH